MPSICASSRFSNRQCYQNCCSRICALFNAHCAAMQPDNLLHERQSQSHAAHCAAARLIHAEKRLKDAVPVLLGNARAGIPHADCRLTA